MDNTASIVSRFNNVSVEALAHRESQGVSDHGSAVPNPTPRKRDTFDPHSADGDEPEDHIASAKARIAEAEGCDDVMAKSQRLEEAANQLTAASRKLAASAPSARVAHTVKFAR